VVSFNLRVDPIRGGFQGLRVGKKYTLVRARALRRKCRALSVSPVKNAGVAGSREVSDASLIALHT